MKTTKKTVKNVKKATKPSFVVDLTDAVTYSDVKLSFIEAKALNGVKLTQDEFKQKMSEYQSKLQEYFNEGNELQREIIEQLKKVKYE